MAYGGGYGGGYGDASPTLSVTVEVAFSTDPAATPTWTDISAYLEGFTVNRGRQRELDTFQAGRARITLANEDRRFDPTYTAGPYYPNVVPMRRLRIRAVWAGVTYDVFTGYVDGWDQHYDPPQSATCIVSATDAFKVLSNIELPASVYEMEVRADTPGYWWRLNEESGSTTIIDTIGGVGAEKFGAPQLGAAGLVTKDPGSAYSALDATSGFAANRQFVPAGSYGTLTLEAIVKTSSAVEATIASLSDPGEGVRVRLYVTATGKAGFQVGKTQAGNTQSALVSSGASINDNQPHHIVGIIDNQAFRHLWIYVDGVGTDGGEIGWTGTWGTTQEFVVGNAARGFIAPAEYTQGVVGTVDEVALWPTTQISAARISAHSAARATPWQNDLSGTRVGKILDTVAWPAGDRTIDTGLAVLQSADLGGTALSLLQQVERTEYGALFITAAGKVRFIARDTLFRAPYTTSQATFGDSGSDLEYADLTYDYDDTLIWNEILVSRVNGAVQVVGDTTSQTRYLKRTRVIDGLLHRSDATSRDLANFELARSKDPKLRVTGLRLEPSAGNGTTHYPQVLGRELLDRVTVKRVPQNLGATIEQQTRIEGITHTVGPVEWVTTWNLSPAVTDAYWILGVAGSSELGETTRLGV